jgi:hypothetical protein
MGWKDDPVVQEWRPPEGDQVIDLKVAEKPWQATAAEFVLDPLGRSVKAIQGSPLGRGMAKGAGSIAGMVADTPQNLYDLLRMGLFTTANEVRPRLGLSAPDLPNISPKRVASSYINEAIEDRLPPVEDTGLNRGVETGAEFATQGLLGGGWKSPGYASLLPGVGAAVGERVGGDTGKILGSLVAPAAAGVGSVGLKYALRGPTNPEIGLNAATLEKAGIPAHLGNISKWGAYVERATSQIPAGAGVKGYQQGKQNQVVEDRLEDLGGKPGVDDFTAGVTIKDGIEGAPGSPGWKQRFDANYGVLRQQTAAAFPDTTRIKPNNFAATLKKLTTPNPGASQSTALNIPPDLRRRLDALNADLASGKGVVTSGALKEIKTEIGRLAYPKKGMVSDVDVAKYEQLYAALAQDLEGAAYQLGPKAYRAMKKENGYYRAGMERVRNFYNDIYAQAEPEKIFKQLTTGTKDSSVMVRTVMKGLKPDQRDIVIAGVLNKMGERVASAKTGASQFDPDRFLTQWNQMSDEAKKALFGGSTRYGMLADLDDIAKAVGVMRETRQVMPNPSGTSLALTGSATVAGLLVDPITTLTVQAGAATAAGLMTSPRFVNWLAKGAKLKASDIKPHIVRLGAIASSESDPGLREAMGAYLSALEQRLNPQ